MRVEHATKKGPGRKAVQGITGRSEWNPRAGKPGAKLMKKAMQKSLGVKHPDGAVKRKANYLRAAEAFGR